MIRVLFYSILLLPILSLLSCSVKRTVTHEYKLEAYSISKRYAISKGSILLSQPEALAGVATESMRYMDKPYEVSNFAHNAWYSPPADMLLPLMVKSMQQSNLFSAVTASIEPPPTDYRLDTQLIDLKQNFLTCPVQLDFIVKTTLTHVPDNRILASKLFEYHIPCKEKTPYGGVLAAQVATKRFTAELTDFIMHHLVH